MWSWRRRCAVWQETVSRVVAGTLDGGKAKNVRWVAVDWMDDVVTMEEEDEREEVVDRFKKSEVEDKSDDREEDDVDTEDRAEEKGEDMLGNAATDLVVCGE